MSQPEIISTPISEAVSRKKIADALKKAQKPTKILAIPKDSHIELEETFNATRLAWIIENFDQVREKLRVFADDPDHSQLLKKLRLYLACSYDYKREMLYRQTESKGRYFATTFGLQQMVREIRGAICSEFYSDIDIVNCGPTILFNICNKNGIETPVLAEYVKNRDAYISKTNLSLENFKTFVIKRIYGAAVWQFNSDAEQELSDEITHIHHEIKKVPKFKELYDKYNSQSEDEAERDMQTFNAYGKKNKGKNSVGRMICDLIFEAENSIIMKVWEYLGKPRDAVLCFDGLQLTNDIEYDLNDIADHIANETGYIVNFKIKEMCDIIQFPYFEKQYEYPRIEYANDYENVSGEGFITSEQVLRTWISNSFAYIKNGVEPVIVEKQYDFDPLYNQQTPNFVFKTWDKFKKSYRKCCKVINPYYSSKFRNENARVGADNPARKDRKFHKYSFFYLSEYLEKLNEQNKIKTYDKVDFIPYLKDKRPNLSGIFNLFTGFVCDDLKPCPDINFEKSAMYAHIINALCAGDADEANHLLDTIADMIQNPAEIKTVAHMFYTESGGGKGRFLDLIKKMIGNKNVVVIEDMSEYLTTRFNSLYACKLVRTFEELSGDGKHKSDLYNKLKGKIDAREEPLEHKGIDPVKVGNFARVFIFTNNMRAMYVERTNRRFELHKGDNTNCDNPKYFAPIIAELDDPRFIKAAFDYFASRIIKTDQRKLYVNTYMREMKNDSLEGPIKFLKYHIETVFASQNLHMADEKPLTISEKKTFRVFQDDFINQYLEFAAKHLAGRANGKSLIETFSEYDIPRDRATRGGKKLFIYVIYPPAIEKLFKSKLRDEEFEFDYGAAETEELEEQPSNGDNITSDEDSEIYGSGATPKQMNEISEIYDDINDA